VIKKLQLHSLGWGIDITYKRVYRPQKGNLEYLTTNFHTKPANMWLYADRI